MALDSPTALMRRILQSHNRLYVAYAGRHALTKQQFIVLRALAEEPNIKQTRITQITGIDRSTLSKMMEGLKKMGYVRAARDDEDQRANSVVITPDGKKAYSRALVHYLNAEEAMFGHLTVREKSVFTSALQSITKAAEEIKTDAR